MLGCSKQLGWKGGGIEEEFRGKDIRGWNIEKGFGEGWIDCSFGLEFVGEIVWREDQMGRTI